MGSAETWHNLREAPVTTKNRNQLTKYAWLGTVRKYNISRSFTMPTAICWYISRVIIFPSKSELSLCIFLGPQGNTDPKRCMMLAWLRPTLHPSATIWSRWRRFALRKSDPLRSYRFSGCTVKVWSNLASWRKSRRKTLGCKKRGILTSQKLILKSFCHFKQNVGIASVSG